MSLAGLNTGGTPLLLVANINDGTGETITVAAAATQAAATAAVAMAVTR